MGIGRLKSESKRCPCYAEEVRLILEPVGLIVMNLEFKKIAPVMVRRLDRGKKAKLSLKESQESVILVQARGGEGRTRAVAMMTKITDLEPQGGRGVPTPFPSGPSSGPSSQSIFSYHLLEIIISHKSSRATFLFQLYTHICLTSSVQFKSLGSKNMKDSTNG